MDLDAYYVLPPTLLERLAGGDLDPAPPGGQEPLLDRLLGAPDDETTAFGGERAVLDDARRRLRHGVAALLSTRRPYDFLPARFADLAGTVIDYGLPDTTAISFRNPAQRLRFRQDLAARIEAFEPRLDSVRIEDAPDGPGGRTAFRLNAAFVLDRRPVPFEIGTALNEVRGHVTVAEAEETRAHGR